MRQNFDYSCGAACVLAVMDIIVSRSIKSHSASEELMVCLELGVSPESGLENEALVSYVQKHDVLSDLCTSHGVNTYKSGVSIANIRNFRSGIGHYVLVLGEENQKYRIWDPIDGRIHLLSASEFEWKSGSGKVENWSINFGIQLESLPSIEQSNKVFILHGENDEFNPRYDTGSFLFEQCFDRGYAVSRVVEEKICIINNELYINGLFIQDKDVVWLKIDPRQDESYFLTLRILSLFEHRINFYNPPSLLLRYDDKFLSLAYKRFSIINSQSLISEIQYLERGNKVVAKRLNGFGGRDVLFFSSKDLASSSLRKSSPYLIEHDISVPDNQNVDTRIFWFKGKYRGAVHRFSNGAKHCNMTQGGGHLSIDVNSFILSLSENLQDELRNLSNQLKYLNVIIAGVDVLNNKQITEVNISNTSVYKNYIEDTGDNFLFAKG